MLKLLNDWGGQLLHAPYSSEISNQHIKDKLQRLGITTATRQQCLRELLKFRKPVLFLDAHNALSGLIAENTAVERSGNNLSFDGIWSGSLTNFTAKSKADIETVDLTSRPNSVNDYFKLSSSR